MQSRMPVIISMSDFRVSSSSARICLCLRSHSVAEISSRSYLGVSHSIELSKIKTYDSTHQCCKVHVTYKGLVN